MSIQLDMVRICGFRGIANLEISLPKVTVLVGQNNSGKTSVIKALQLALGDYSRYLSDEDFHISHDDKRQEIITVDIRFVPTQNSDGVNVFSEEWQQEFGDKIQSEANGNQFVAIRTIVQPDKIKGGYIVKRFHLDVWPEKDLWQNAKTYNRNRLTKRLESIPFISIDAQRDIHTELKEKSSFIGRVLSSVEYNEKDVEELERMVAEINNEAINKSEHLKQLKNHLDDLNQSFEGSGETELTPFPKKIRDLSKKFSVHFGESKKNSFSMEYHGMGTRSWASMLTVKAFIELQSKKHEDEAEPFFPILAAEEPEAHLHPNAQRTMFDQLSKSRGQIIISTHSPYLVSMSRLRDLRGLKQKSLATKSFQLVEGLEVEDIRNLERHVTRLRGELLFSKAIILCEGITEEQLIPAMFQLYCGKNSFSLGITCIDVSGMSYSPFIQMAFSFGIPTLIVSDNDNNTKTSLERHIRNIRKNKNIELTDTNFFISFLTSGNDLEAELLNELQIKDEIVDALVKAKTRGGENPDHVESKTDEINALNDDKFLEEMRDCKASYAGYLADIIIENKNNRPAQELIPQAIIKVFDKLKEWEQLW